jgi:hypothetical protein
MTRLRTTRLRTKRLLWLKSVTLCMCLSWAVLARADAVTDWNAIAIQTIASAMVNGVPAHPGATALLDSAIVQAAVYDAVVAIDGRFKPYHVQIPGASGSPAVAVAKAAHDVLVNREFSPEPDSFHRRNGAWCLASDAVLPAGAAHDPLADVGSVAGCSYTVHSN